MLTQAKLKSIMRYDPATGHLYWLEARNGGARKGDRAGCYMRGYIMVKIDGRSYGAHRLAFLYMTGSLPEMVDHKNGVRGDNRWINLRAATRKQNCANSKLQKRNKLGLKGVYQASKGAFVARIKHNGQLKYLGSFKSAAEAHAAYVEAAHRLHGEFARIA